ncbi:MAG: tyrosine-protein phosphatase [Thermoleophilia bacterium]
MRLIDIHCHILPGMDDGPSELALSLAMARVAAADGIGKIVVTPHVIEGLYDAHERDMRITQLSRAMAREGIAIKLYAGAEVPMSMCLSEGAEFLGELSLAGSRYLLMETADTTYDQLARAIHQVRLNGLYPILAHPERVTFIKEQPSNLEKITAQGYVYCQITAASIEGKFGKSTYKCAMSLLKLGLVHLVASDGHSADTRPPQLSECYRHLCELLGSQAAETIMLDNSRRVIKNQLLETVSPIRRHRVWFISRIFRSGE